MHLKVESDHSKPQLRGHDFTNNSNNIVNNCTSSIYISHSIANDFTNQLNKNDFMSQTMCDEPEKQKPVLTIQVNQNGNSNLHQYNNGNTNNNNLVNIVSCVSATSSKTLYATAINHDIENVAKNNIISGIRNNTILPFNVSVNTNYEVANCSGRDENLIKYNRKKNSIKNGGNNKNNLNITNCEFKINGMNHQNVTNSKTNLKISSKSISCNDLNEISVIDQIIISNSNVDYNNMSLDTITNQPNGEIKLTSMETENQNKELIKNCDKNKNSSNNNKNNTMSFSQNEINQISIVKSEITNSPEAATTNNANNIMESTNNQNRLERENSGSKSAKVEITYREKRRHKRRERRQAQQRIQHDQRHHVSVHHSNRLNGINRNSNTNHIRGINDIESTQRVISGYEMLPDIINNHLPPPYTTIPLLQLLPESSPAIQMISSPSIVVDDCRISFPIPIIRRSPSEHSGRKGCCGQFFYNSKSLGIIAIIALGGIVCALGGAAWGASGLAGQPSTHLTISLLMIGIGVVLVTISGVAWRITNGADGSACFGIEGSELDHFGRQQCVRNNSMSHGLLYPEFQHRQPPPTYQASMQEYRLRLLLLDRDRHSHARRITNQQLLTSTPPPSYRSNNGPFIRSIHYNRVTAHPNGSRNSNGTINELGNSNTENVTSEISIQQSSNNKLFVTSKDVAKRKRTDSVMKLSTESSKPNEVTQINHKNQQQIQINQYNTSDAPTLHQVEVNSCESLANNQFVNTSSKLDPTMITASPTCSNNKNNETGMITIVTINNNSDNNYSKLINEANSLV